MISQIQPLRHTSFRKSSQKDQALGPLPWGEHDQTPGARQAANGAPTLGGIVVIAIWLLAGLLLLPSTNLGQDWAQFLGPTRSGIYPGELAASWPAGGPAVLWKKPVGQGFSAPVVAEGRLILFHRLGSKETVECLDAKNGRPLWKFDYLTSYRDDFGFDEGPRATPTIAHSRVYAFGAEGTLHCLDLATGKKLWRADTHQQFGVRKGFFGAACSPLVEGQAVVLNIGGGQAGLVAFDRDTGKVLWTATDDEASYSSPVAATIKGLRHLIAFTRSGLVDVDPANGKVRFELPWRARMQASVNAATPLVIGDQVFISASYQTGATLLQIDGATARKLWTSDEVLSNHYATSVVRDGYLYGYHGRQEEGPSLRCAELQSAKVVWNVERFGAGTVTLAGNQLVLLKEDGELLLAPASPKEFRPVSRTKLLPATVRAYPAIAHGLLYARNEDTLICVDLRR
jgi:outer membrane protein assembly factor BamB